jgi:hypothetical protein
MKVDKVESRCEAAIFLQIIMETHVLIKYIYHPGLHQWICNINRSLKLTKMMRFMTGEERDFRRERM